MERHLQAAFLLFCFLKIGSHESQAGILNFGSSTSKVPGYRHVPQHPVYAAMGLEPGALCMLRKPSSQGTMALGSAAYVFIFSTAGFMVKAGLTNTEF